MVVVPVLVPVVLVPVVLVVVLPVVLPVVLVVVAATQAIAALRDFPEAQARQTAGASLAPQARQSLAVAQTVAQAVFSAPAAVAVGTVVSLAFPLPVGHHEQTLAALKW